MDALIYAWVAAFATGGTVGLLARWLRNLVADEPNSSERG